MSAAVSSSRGNTRPLKDKHGKSTPQIQQTKSEGPPQKTVQATPEQIRLAQLTNDTSSVDESAFKQKVKQVMDITGITEETDVAIALQDCGNDTAKAIDMLIEGNAMQGEWKETGKKKKKATPQPAKTEPVNNHVDEKVEEPEPTTEREKIPDRDRSENISRRGRRYDNRYDTRPPRLAARGRGRDRPNRENNDNDAGEFGGTFGQDRGFDGRGRGRGRGGRGGSRRGGRGRSFNSQPSRERPPQKFEKGPQIDTWTNETAENAEKENTSGPWGDGIEDWNDDTWQGNNQPLKLTESKVFESSVQSREPEPMTDSTNTIGQRIDLGALLQKPTTESPESYLTQYNQQATESIKNSIGIGSSSRQSLSNQMAASSLTNHLSSGPLGGHSMNSASLADSIAVSSPSSAAVDALVSSLTQNSNLSAGVNGTTIDLSALTQNSQRTNLDLTSLAPQSRQNALDLTSMSQNRQSVPMSMPSQADSMASSQQRPKPQRSKLPPPSKIPASAVEMPGHRSTNKVDVQFGNWESSFGFGNSESVVPTMSNSSSTGTSQQQNESVITSSMMTPPPSAGTSVITSQESPRTSMFHNSPYSTPTKKDQSSLSQNQISPPDTIPFATQDRKSSPMMAPQRPGSNPGLSQGTLSTSSPESSGLGSFSQGGYGTNPYQSQKSSGLSGAAGLSNSSGLSSSRGLSSSELSAPNRLSNSAGLPSKSDFTQSPASSQSSYQSQYQTGNQFKSSQNQFQTGQNQYQSGQSQFHSGQSQYYGQSGSTFQRDSSSFGGSQSQTGGYQSNQNGQGSQTSSYSSSRGSSFPGGQSSNQAPPGAYPGNQNESGSYNLTGNQNQGSSFSDLKNQTASYDLKSQSGSFDMKNQGSSFSDPSGQSGSYSGRQNTSSSFNDRQTSSAGSFGAERTGQTGSYGERQNQTGSFGERQSQSAGSYSSERTNQQNSFGDRNSQSGSYSDRSSQQGTYPGGSSFSSVSQPSQSYSVNQNGQSSLYQTGVSNTYQGQNQPGSIYHQGGSSQTTAYQPQVSSYSRDSQSGTFSTNVTQSNTSFQRDSSSVTQSSFTSGTFGSSSHQTNLQSNLPSTGLSGNKLGETLSKMTVKDNNMDSRQSPSQFDSSSSTTANFTSTTTSSLISTVSTPSVSSTGITTTVQSTSAKVSTTSSSTSKAPPNLPPGVPLLSHQYIMGGQNLPYFGLQQPLYGYEDLQLLQQRLPPMNLQNLQNYNYDMTAFGNVPTSLNTGREQNTVTGNIPYSGTDNKLTRVEAQSPIPTTQQQSTQSHQQHQFINLPYGYCYPGTVLPGAPTAMGFQYPPQMFQVPPVTNTAAPHAGTTANAQFQKQTYGSHSYGSNKGYEDLNQVSDFTKSTYINQSQNKVSAVSGSATTGTADLSGTGLTGVTGYGKTQQFATGSQAGSHIGAPNNPYGAAQFIPLMTHQPPSHINLQGLQQDTSSASSGRIHSQQTSSQAKAVTPKGYTHTNTYWGSN